MTAQHNHPPRCCCASLDMGASYGPDDDHCPGCVIHGALAALKQLDGTRASAVRLLGDLTPEELDEVGGVDE